MSIENTQEALILSRVANGDNPIVSWSKDGKATWDYSLCETVERLEAEGRIAHERGCYPWNLMTRWFVNA